MVNHTYTRKKRTTLSHFLLLSCGVWGDLLVTPQGHTHVLTGHDY